METKSEKWCNMEPESSSKAGRYTLPFILNRFLGVIYCVVLFEVGTESIV